MPKYTVGDTAVYFPGLPTIPAAMRAATRYKLYGEDEYTDAIFPMLNKYLDPTRTSTNQEPGQRDHPLMRLANTYLMLAEALHARRQVGPGAPVDQQGARARGEAGPAAAMEITAADLDSGGVDFILDERARELTGETTRWFDLTRTGKLVERVQKYNPGGAPNIKAVPRAAPDPERRDPALDRGHEAEPGLLIHTESCRASRSHPRRPTLRGITFTVRPRRPTDATRRQGGVITGASTGIGRACALRFAREGARLVARGPTASRRRSRFRREIERGGGHLHRRRHRRRAAAPIPSARSTRASSATARSTSSSATRASRCPSSCTRASDDEIERLLAGEPARRRVRGAARDPAHARAAVGRHDAVHGEQDGARRADRFAGVLRLEGRGRDARQGARARLRHARHPRERALSRASSRRRCSGSSPIRVPIRRRRGRRTPRRSRWDGSARAEECADAALWLVSDEASFITGVALPVDGGFTAM